MEASDSQLPIRVPSPIEIVGAIAAAAPFAISMASSSWETVNGQVTSFTYRDPVAIACGVVAAICGVVSLATALRRTEASKKAVRVVLCIVLLGAGAFQVLRGLGIVGVDKPVPSTTVEVTPPIAPPTTPAAAKPVDTDGATELAQTIVSLWRTNKMAELLELAQPEVTKDFDIFDLQHIHDTYEESFGALQKTGELSVAGRSGVIDVKGPAIFERATLDLELTLIRVDGKLRWRGLSFDIPKGLQRKPVPADGDAHARKVVDTVLTKKFVWALFHPRLVDRTPADIEEQLDGLFAKFGPITKIGDPVERACDEARCVTFPITGKKLSGSFEVDLTYAGYAWRAVRWNLTPE